MGARVVTKARTLTIAAFLALTAPSLLRAQDLLITNARIIDSREGTASQGNILVRGGRIAALGEVDEVAGIPVLDAAGMSALPGYIDGHRHIMPDNDPAWLRESAAVAMAEYLQAGVTTLMSGGGPVPGIVELQELIDSGRLKGPRIITSGRADPDNFPEAEAARAQVRALAAAGVEIVKARLEEGGQDILAVVVDEAAKHNLKVMVHAVTVPLTIDAVEAGAAKLVHTPTRSLIEETDGARIVSEAGVHMTSTLGIWVPIYGPGNEPQWRDGTPFPDDAIARAGVGPVNGRHLWNAGVVYGFGTDTSFLPHVSLAHELIPLRLVFSPRDIVKIMGPNTAEFVDRASDLGMLEPGKLADIVLVEGDPLVDADALLNVRVALKGGEVMIDSR